ncbi:hypothetical protein LDENG_00292730 [Lucifuga dentata]|nr:hypothetical protein LDENG_00292730 [Lucifuga dentata]
MSLEEGLTCSVCRDTFSQAHPLPCGHSFCPTCVREAWASQGEGKGRFTCSQCQEEQAEVLCDCCFPEAEDGPPSVAVKTCLRCEVSLCAEHLQPHLERPAFSTHLLVDPLGDLSQRRRLLCALHKAKALKHVEGDLKVILQTLLQKAEEKVEHGVRILKEHQNVDCTISHTSMEESLEDDDTQVERMGSDLQVQVKKLVAALREITRRERQQVIERVQEDCSKVREHMSQMQNIQHYLSSLLAETDPFLLIWAFQSDDSKLVADLNSPLFTPDPISLDRKHILEVIESEYRQFIAATLRCLSDLKKELCE